MPPQKIDQKRIEFLNKYPDLLKDIPCTGSLIPDEHWGYLTVAQEARYEPFEGKIAVAEVIRNRMRYKISSDGSVRGTVLFPYQFSGWNTRDPNRVACAGIDYRDKELQDIIAAWKIAFEKGTNLTQDAILYHADYVSPDWSKVYKKTVVIGRHIFYSREKI